METNHQLVELTKNETIIISGGEVSPLGHVLRAISFSALGVAYWLGYAVGSNNQ